SGPLTAYRSPLWQLLPQQPQGVSAHDLAYLVLVKTRVDQRLGDLDQPSGVERGEGVSVEVRPQSHVVHSDEIGHVADRPRNRGRRQVANRGVPEADPDEAAIGPDPADLIIREVPR